MAHVNDRHRRCVFPEQGLVLLQVSLRQVLREEELSACCGVLHKILCDHAPARWRDSYQPLLPQGTDDAPSTPSHPSPNETMHSRLQYCVMALDSRAAASVKCSYDGECCIRSHSSPYQVILAALTSDFRATLFTKSLFPVAGAAQSSTSPAKGGSVSGCACSPGPVMYLHTGEVRHAPLSLTVRQST